MGSSLIALRNVRLTPRDVAILKAIVDYQLLSTSQIQTLFFRSVHRTRKRLHQLFRAGLLRRISRPVIIGHGQADRIYGISGGGLKALRLSGQTSLPSKVSTKGQSFMFLNHLLLRNDIRIILTRSAEKRRDIRLVNWRQDRSIAFLNPAPFLGRCHPDRTEKIIADGRFELICGPYKITCYLEIDCGTASLARISRKIAQYQSYFISSTSKYSEPNSAFLWRNFRSSMNLSIWPAMPYQATGLPKS